VVEALIVSLGDESKDVRCATACMLFKIADPRAVEALVVSLGDESEDVRQWAAKALSKARAPRRHKIKSPPLGQQRTKKTKRIEHDVLTVPSKEYYEQELK